MAVIVDTSALWSKEVLHRLRDRDDVIVPSVVFMERARQIVTGGGRLESFVQYLRRSGWPVAPFEELEALRSVRLAHVAPDRWRALFRDAMIAGHVGPHDQLWTFNPRDFLALGIPDRQVVDLGTPS